MKSKLLTLSIALFLVQPAFAKSDVPQPQACPSVSAIKAVGVNLAIDTGMVGWAGANLSNTYNTPEEWSFLIFGISANDETDALAKANSAISTLTLVDGPSKTEKEWGCIYSSQASQSDGIPAYVGIAVTPPMSGPPTSLLARFKK